MIDVKDVVKEGKSGNIEAVAGLTKDQTVGILANIKKDVDQPANVVTEKGLGSYGLSLENLQLLKIVKGGITPAPDLETTLNDASVFTGLRSVNSVNVLLSNEDLQKTLMQEVITKNTASLQRQGVISGFEGPEIAAGVAGASAKFNVSEIKDYANGTASPEITDGINKAQAGADFAVNLTDTKASSALEKVKGIGGGSIKPVKSAVDTISTPQLNKNVDDFIGSKRVPSAVTEADTAALAEQAKQAASIPANALTGVTKSTTSSIATVSTPTVISKIGTTLNKGDLF